MDSISDFITQLLSGQAGAQGVGSLALSILLAYAGGILSSLTPCVYPMIPITLSVVGGIRNSKRSWQEIWLRAAVYVLGMAMIYAFLGVAAGLTGKVFGSFTNTPGWYLGLSVVITIAALMMMDVFTFDPLMLWERLKRTFGGRRTHAHSQAAHNREVTLLGAFTLGASSGFIAAPCTTPVLTSILAYIAQSQSAGFGLALMLAFSFGLGTILMGVAAFAGALQVLPRSGAWMKAVKLGSGLLLLLFAQYLVYQAGKLGGL